MKLRGKASLVLALSLAVSGVLPSSAQEEVTVDVEATAPVPEPVEGRVQTLGDADAKLHLVRRGESWSMHAENLPADRLFALWHEAGGPEVISKILIDFPYTLSVHGLAAERIVARVLDGYGYTLHYDAAGRLERVRVYSPEANRMFKTPRLVESLGRWREAENPRAPAPLRAAQQPETEAPVE